jgi:Protein of unknown function (DUF962)
MAAIVAQIACSGILDIRDVARLTGRPGHRQAAPARTANELATSTPAVHPTMIEPPLTPDPRVQRWLLRHPHPTSFILHMIGIPPTFLGALFVPIYLCMLSWSMFLLALGLFVGGYLLQFAGHFLEGTDPGEIIYFKRKLGRPFVEFPRPRAARRRPTVGAPAPSA